MSRNTNNVKRNPVMPFCQVCKDTGKTEAEYRSHFTRESRDPNAKVVCPTLLALECKYCSKNGHTIKYCDDFKKKQNQKKHKEDANSKSKLANSKPKSATKDQVKTKNIYMCLDMDSDNEEQKPEAKKVSVAKKPVIKDEFPILCAPVANRAQSKNYAAALAKPPVLVDLVPVKKPIEKTIEKPVVVSTSRPAPWASSKANQQKAKWAAWNSDSDTDGEDEYNEEYEEDSFPDLDIQNQEYTDAWD